MIPAPRIAVIDDEAEHIKAIRESLEQMGTSCLPVLVEAGRPSVNEQVSGIRLLFLDVHLINPVMEGAALFDANGAILKQVLSEQNGPYVLVVWTSDKAKRDGLLEHLSDHYPEIPKPLASILMAKEDFLSNGIFDIQKVSSRISELLQENPQATALLHWENAVAMAAGRLIGSLTDFVDRKQLFLGAANEDLRQVLTAIAQSAVGLKNVSANELASINEGFMPLLFDSLIHLPDAEGLQKEKWANAISEPDVPARLDAGKKAKLNTMYHLARDVDSLKIGDRGAVYEIKKQEIIASLFPGFWPEHILKAYFDCHNANADSLKKLRELVAWCLIGLRPACDQAQPKPGMYRVVLASMTPENFKIDGVRDLKESPGRYRSVALNSGGDDGFVLGLNFNFLASLAGCQFDSFELSPSWRLRDSICIEIESKFASHASRPGIIRFD
jgi:hypothetical protein